MSNQQLKSQKNDNSEEEARRHRDPREEGEASMQHDAKRPLREESSPGKASKDSAGKEGAERADPSRAKQGINDELQFLVFPDGTAANEANNAGQGDDAEVRTSLQNPIGMPVLSQEGEAGSPEQF